MKPNEIIAELLKMKPEDVRHVIREYNRLKESRARNAIDEGMTVKFTARGGAVIQGVVKKVNPKNIIVEASMDRHGFKTPRPVRWTVSPSLLSVVEDDAAKT